MSPEYSFRVTKSICEAGNFLRKTRRSGEARTMSPMELKRIINVLSGVNTMEEKYVEIIAGAMNLKRENPIEIEP